MFDEGLLLAAILKDRESYNVAMKIGLEANDFSDAGKLLLQCAAEQYKRDEALPAVLLDVLRTQIERRVKNKGMAESYTEYARGLPEDISRVNISEEYRLLRRARIAMQLASRLASGQHDSETDELLSKYGELNQQSGNEISYRLTPEDFDGRKGERIPLAPARLNEFVGGGVLRGHNITVYGRPDSGKSLFGLNQAAFACAHGFKVLYVANEEPAQDITRRLLARLSQQPVQNLQGAGAIRAALEKCGPAYADRWFLLHKAGATIKDVRAAAGDIGPDIIVIDQIKNIAVKEDNRALQLDRLAREVRETGIEYGAVTISVTQAGISAHNKLVLTMDDVEWSNTGIPGAADLMIAIGVTDEYDLQNKRQISIPKNKVNGAHGNFPVWVDPKRTAFMSRPNRGKD